MITSYEVGAVFRLVDEASPTLRALSERLTALDKLAGTVRKSMQAINEVRVGSFGEGLRAIDERMRSIGEKALGVGSKTTQGLQRADTAITETGRKLQGLIGKFDGIEGAAKAGADGIAGSLGRADTALGGAVEKATALTTALREAGAASRDIPRLPSGGGFGGGGGGHPRPGQDGGHGPSHAEVGMNVGLMGAMGLGEVVEGLKHVVEAGAKLEKFQAQLEAATGSMAKVADATAAAWAETGKNLNTNVADNLRNLQHLMNVVGSLDEAKTMLHPFTLADTALASIKDDSIAGGKGSKSLELNAYNVARSLEQLGVTQDEEKLQSYTSNITRMMIGMRGLVDGSKLFQGINNAGGSRYGWNEDFVTYGLGPLLQATNGRAGAQLYQLNRSYFQGVSTEQMAINAEKYGLWSATDEYRDSKGHFKGMNVGSIFESDVLKSDPVKWAGDVREMWRKRGVDVDDTNAMTNVVAEVTRGNKNLGAIMDELVLPNSYAALMKERKNIEAVPQDAVDILQKHDPGVAMKAFNEQFENLLIALGKPSIASAADTLNRMAAGLNTLAQWSAANPMVGKVLIEGMTAVGASLAVLTGVGVIAALAFFLPGGAFAIGASAIVGVFADLAAFHWDTLRGAMDALKGVPAAIGDFIDGLLDRLRTIPGIGHLIPGGKEELGPPMPPKTFVPPNPAANANTLPDGVGLMAYTAGANDNSSAVDMLAQGVYKGLMLYANGGGAAGGLGGGGSGFINASWGGGGGGDGGGGGGGGGGWGGNALAVNGGFGGGSWSKSGATRPEVADYIKTTAAKMGIDPNVALRVSQSEGFNAYTGDYGTSFGPFQLHYGGSGIRGMNSGGLGDRFTRETGLNARDPTTWKAQVEYALKMAKREGWGAWHGAARVGIGSHQGLDWHGPAPVSAERPAAHPTVDGRGTAKKVSPGAPAAAPTTSAMNEEHHHHVYIDGREVAKAVTKRQVAALRYPNATGGPNGRTHYRSPGTMVTDAA